MRSEEEDKNKTRTTLITVYYLKPREHDISVSQTQDNSGLPNCRVRGTSVKRILNIEGKNKKF